MRTPKPLQQYKGPLTIPQICAGMNAATENATRLAKDARLLLSNGCFPSAASLATLSIEESGKVVILRRFVTSNKADLKDLWREYRSHTKKNINWIFPELVAKGARKLEDFRTMVREESDHPEVLDALKQIGFYTDCLGKGNWTIPADTVDEKLATQLVRTAEILAPERKMTTRELELWEKHMKPVWNVNFEWMKQALVNWYADMQSEGIAPAGANPMERCSVF